MLYPTELQARQVVTIHQPGARLHRARLRASSTSAGEDGRLGAISYGVLRGLLRPHRRSCPSPGEWEGAVCAVVDEATQMLRIIMAEEDLTESIVRQHLRDRPGEARCAGCLARDLSLQSGSTLARILVRPSPRAEIQKPS